jgi:hypothetical protein
MVVMVGVFRLGPRLPLCMAEETLFLLGHRALLFTAGSLYMVLKVPVGLLHLQFTVEGPPPVPMCTRNLDFKALSLPHTTPVLAVPTLRIFLKVMSRLGDIMIEKCDVGVYME